MQLLEQLATFMAAVHMLKAYWMYGDAGMDLLGHSVARLDPFRWSKSMDLERLALDLDGVNRGRPIRVRVKNYQADARQQNRSYAVVEQVFANANVAVSALRDLSRSLVHRNDQSSCHPGTPSPSQQQQVHQEADDGRSLVPNHDQSPCHPGTPFLPQQQQVDQNADDCRSLVHCDDQFPCDPGTPFLSQRKQVDQEADDSNAVESFYSCASWTGGSVIGEESVDVANVCHPESTPMSVLRAHISSGLPLLVRWMWGDAGLAALLPRTACLVESNPWRWSVVLSLGDASRQLEEWEARQDAVRPVRLQVWSGSGEEALHVSFATTASDVAVAGSILWEINEWVRALDHQELGTGSCDSFQSFAHEALAARGPSLSRSFSSESSSFFPQPCARQSLSLQRPLQPKLPPSNSNRVTQYRWLSELMESIICGSAGSLSENLGTGERATPLFVVAGFCPNAMIGMQAVLFCQLDERKIIDFWWVKPQTDNPNILERNTLHLHSTGRFKNVPGKSRAVYAPFAEKFSGRIDKGDFHFGVEGGRAFIEKRQSSSCHESGEAGRRRMLIYFVWQESWSSLFSTNKFVQGKMGYQHCEPGSQPLTGDEARFFARQYRIEGGQLEIAEEEEEVPSMMPPDHFQEMFDMRE